MIVLNFMADWRIDNAKWTRGAVLHFRNYTRYREDWDHAIETYEKALRKGAKDAAVLSDLGAAYRNRGEFKRAIASFEKARAADPDHWQSLLNLVLVNAFEAKDPA